MESPTATAHCSWIPSWEMRVQVESRVGHGIEVNHSIALAARRVAVRCRKAIRSRRCEVSRVAVAPVSPMARRTIAVRHSMREAPALGDMHQGSTPSLASVSSIWRDRYKKMDRTTRCGPSIALSDQILTGYTGRCRQCCSPRRCHPPRACSSKSRAGPPWSPSPAIPYRYRTPTGW